MKITHPNIKITGVVDQINRTAMVGWIAIVLLDGQSQYYGDYPEIELLIDEVVISKCVASLSRPDLKVENRANFGFSLDISLINLKSISSNRLKVIAKIDGHSLFELQFWEPLQLALKVNDLRLNGSELYKNYNKFLGYLDFTIDKILEKMDRSSRTKSKPLCIITYANSAGAWFPYFFDYYKNIVGSEAIYVVTPVPMEFIHLNLGGIVTIKNMLFDDVARGNLMSDLASGLQNYYTWSLVSDVDEIVMPDPRHNVSLLEFLQQQTDPVIVGLGLDVIEQVTDQKFDFCKAIYEQRSIAIPNSALCKPHLSRIPIKYSPGFHYCNHEVKFSSTHINLLTLHLKYACSAIRDEISVIVAKTTYESKKTEEYCMTSVQRLHHPVFPEAIQKDICHLDGVEINQFKQQYMSNLKNYGGMWGGEFFVLPVLISLTDLNCNVEKIVT